MNNGDKLRNLTNEQLAEVLMNLNSSPLYAGNHALLNKDLYDDFLCWVNKESDGFDKDIFDSISSLYEESGYPSLFLVGIKYEGIEIQYYKASLKENPSGDPEQMYSDFELIIDTGSIKDSLIPKSLALN